MSEYPGLDNYAERKRLFERCFIQIATEHPSLSTEQCKSRASEIVNYLCPKRKFKRTPNFGTLGKRIRPIDRSAREFLIPLLIFPFGPVLIVVACFLLAHYR